MIMSLIQGNFLFTIFVILAVSLVLRWGRQAPHQIEVKITETGVDVGERKNYPYDRLLGFATRRLDPHEEGMSELILRQKHRLSTYVKILVPNKITEEVRLRLNQRLPEIEYEESLVDHISRLLKF